MSAKRFVVECVWSGYRSGQEHVCHRTVIPAYLAKRLEKIHTIAFTDGTTMSVAIRPATFREKVQEKRGYVSLLDKMAYSGKEGCVSVMDVN